MRSLRPCSDSSATPSFPSQPEGKIGLPRANPRGRLTVLEMLGYPKTPQAGKKDGRKATRVRTQSRVAGEAGMPGIGQDTWRAEMRPGL